MPRKAANAVAAPSQPFEALALTCRICHTRDIRTGPTCPHSECPHRHSTPAFATPVFSPPSPELLPSAVRPSRDALIVEGLRMMRVFGPPASDRDNHRTAVLIADRVDACWDFFEGV